MPSFISYSTETYFYDSRRSKRSVSVDISIFFAAILQEMQTPINDVIGYVIPNIFATWIRYLLVPFSSI